MSNDAEPDLTAETRAFVRPLVARGDRIFAEILDEACEFLSESFDDEAAVKRTCESEIGQAFADHFAAQGSWPAVTDCDRLDQAFSSLNDGGIVAMHDFSCCQNCGLAEIGAEIADARESGVDVTGFVFYHQQDTDSATEGHGLYLTYGHVEGGEAESVAIGRIVANALTDAGLETKWDGTLKTRIGVPMVWRRRIPPSAALRLVEK